MEINFAELLHRRCPMLNEQESEVHWFTRPNNSPVINFPETVVCKIDERQKSRWNTRAHARLEDHAHARHSGHAKEREQQQSLPDDLNSLRTIQAQISDWHSFEKLTTSRMHVFTSLICLWSKLETTRYQNFPWHKQWVLWTREIFIYNMNVSMYLSRLMKRLIQT